MQHSLVSLCEHISLHQQNQLETRAAVKVEIKVKHVYRNL